MKQFENRARGLPQKGLYLFGGYALFWGKTTDTAEHVHHLIQITLSPQSTFKLVIDNHTIESSALLIDSDIAHKFEVNDSLHLIVLIDPEMEVASKLRLMLNKKAYMELNSALFLELYQTILGSDLTVLTPDRISMAIDKLLNTITDRHIIANPSDYRIIKLLRYINGTEDKNISVKVFADYVNLSESRLIHLFSEEVGIPIRRYLLWKKLYLAMQTIFEGKDFTYAAHQAGFSDSAHLSRTFKKMFGLTLQNLFK